MVFGLSLLLRHYRDSCGNNQKRESVREPCMWPTPALSLQDGDVIVRLLVTGNLQQLSDKAPIKSDSCLAIGVRSGGKLP